MLSDSVNLSALNWRIGIYTRLSVEYNGKPAAGVSIQSQTKLIEDYIKHDYTLSKCKTFAYTDNGFSGTGFNRTAFCKMLGDIHCGKINCVIVKDISRFGRNYIECGDYIENVFPSLSVRFISVAENFDSLREQNAPLSLELLSVVHDYYAKDISKKVSSALYVRKKSGRFTSKLAPYGYRHDCGASKLVVDKSGADVIRLIFRLRIGGRSLSQISDVLNRLSIPTAFNLRYIENHNDGSKTAIWRPSTIHDVLQNPYYAGHTPVQKSICRFGKKTAVSKSQILLVKNTHEAIIDEKSFAAANNISKRGANKNE